MRNGDRHMERKGYKMNGVRVGLSEIKELSESGVKTACTITPSPRGDRGFTNDPNPGICSSFDSKWGISFGSRRDTGGGEGSGSGVRGSQLVSC